MYAYISGNVRWITKESVVIDNQGIGYELLTPMPNRFKVNETAILYTYFYVREDVQQLFGFESQEALSFFETIITVKGVGPKTGLTIMGRVPFNRVVDAIELGDVTFLKSLPGIGPKMASQMVLDLKGKLVTSDDKVTSNPVLDEVYSALEGLGFKKAEINSIKNALIKTELQDVDALIRKALQLLAR